MGTRYNNSHRKALERMIQNPEYINIDRREILSASIEPKLFYRGGFYAEPDLVFFLKRRVSKKEKDIIPLRVLVIEYKSNGQEKLIKKGMSQLAISVDYYQKILKLPAEGRLITGVSYPLLRE